MRLLSDVYHRGGGGITIASRDQTIHVGAATGGIIHVDFKRKPPQAVLEALRGMGKWSWKYRNWRIGGTVKHLTCLFKALAPYLDELTREGSVKLRNVHSDIAECWKI